VRAAATEVLHFGSPALCLHTLRKLRPLITPEAAVFDARGLQQLLAAFLEVTRGGRGEGILPRDDVARLRDALTLALAAS
jgi:hypothetical protein